MPTQPSLIGAGSPRRVAATLAAAASLLAATAAPAQAASPTVTCAYTFSAWPGGFSAKLSMANSGPTINGWTAHWTFAAPTQATAAWSARLTQATPVDVVATPAPWDQVIATGTAVSFGWTATAVVTGVPTDITVNGTRC